MQANAHEKPKGRKSVNMKAITLLLSSLALAACAGGYNPRFYYSNVEVANLSGGDISNVEVQIGADGRTLRCEAVAKNALCQERFGKRPYPQQPVELSWQDSNGNAQSVQVDPQIPATMVSSQSLRVLLDIQQDGSVKARFRQDDLKFGS
jgi:hypothetical protein